MRPLLPFALLAACSADSPAPAQEAAPASAQAVTLAYTGRIDGEIEPCG